MLIHPTLCENSIVSREILDLFLIKLKYEKSNSALWNDFLAASTAVRSNNSRNLVNLFDKSDDIIRFSVFGGISIIAENRKEKLAKFKEALYNVIHMADFRSKRHFDPKPPDYVMNKLTIHRVLELFCKRV